MLRHCPNWVTCAVDSSFADCEFTARSTSGFVVWYGGCPIAWECKRQPLVTMSTMESEYVAASRAVLEIRYINQLTEWMKIPRPNPVQCHEDNAACVAISTNPVHRQRSKHINVKYHNVREACLNKEVVLLQVWTEHQVADIFTKSLEKTVFNRFRNCLVADVRWRHECPKCRKSWHVDVDTPLQEKLEMSCNKELGGCGCEAAEVKYVDPSLTHFDEMMQKHIKVVKEKQVNYCSVTICGTCCSETGRPRKMSCGEYCMNTHSAQWPELCIPFEVGNPIYHEIILGNDYTPDGFLNE